MRMKRENKLICLNPNGTQVMTRNLKSSPNQNPESAEPGFLLLQTECLASLPASRDDEIAAALGTLADSSPVEFTVDNAIALCEQAISLLGQPETTANAAREPSSQRSELEADAYDAYFPVIRVDGDARHVFAWSLLLAF